MGYRRTASKPRSRGGDEAMPRSGTFDMLRPMRAPKTPTRTPPPARSKAGAKPKAPPSSEPGEDARYLADYDPRAFDRPSITVDVALLSVKDDALVTLLLSRTRPPFRGRHALPGGFLRMDEPLERAIDDAGRRQRMP